MVMVCMPFACVLHTLLHIHLHDVAESKNIRCAVTRREIDTDTRTRPRTISLIVRLKSWIQTGCDADHQTESVSIPVFCNTRRTKTGGTKSRVNVPPAGGTKWVVPGYSLGMLRGV